MFAVGVETRRETLSARPDAGSFTNTDPDSPLYGQPSLWDGATTGDIFNVSRTVDSAFVEVRVPVVGKTQAIRGLHTLDLDIAVRHDKYSDTEDPTVPKVTLRWFPFNDELAFRATYSRSFSAPALYSLFGPGSVGYTDQPIGLEFVDGRIMNDEVDQAFGRTINNPELGPERAKNYNFGVIYSPKGVRGLSMELTYFRIEQSQISGLESDVDILQDVETNGASSEFVDRVRFGSFNGTKATAPGQVSAAFDDAGGSFTRVFVTNFAENFVSAKQDGVDATVDYTFDVPSIARFDVALNGVWFNRYSVEDEDFVGTTNGGSSLNGGTLPRWLATLNVEMTRGNAFAGFFVTHLPSVTDTTADEAETDVTSDRHVEQYTSVDAYIGYRFKPNAANSRYLDGLTLRVGARNLFNEAPPMAAASWTDSNADTSTYNELGRVMYVSANYKF
jgi:iron complex outermembrane receptor protein